MFTSKSISFGKGTITKKHIVNRKRPVKGEVDEVPSEPEDKEEDKEDQAL